MINKKLRCQDYFLESLKLDCEFQVRAQHRVNPIEDKSIDVKMGESATVQLRPTYYNLMQSQKYGFCTTDIPREVLTYPYSASTCRWAH